MRISRNKFRSMVWLCGCLVLAMVLAGEILPAAEVAVIKVQYRQADELVPVVESMLSAGGSVTVSQRVNSLVIVDTPEAIQRVRLYLQQFDRPVEQVRIRVRFNTAGSDDERSVGARGRVSNDDLSVSTGRRRKDGVDIRIEDREHRQSSYSEAFVVAMSGSPAFIRSGKEIPYRSSPAFFRRHAPGGATVVWQNAESGFEVTPTILGDSVHLKIVPRIAYDDDKDGVIRFFGAQTEITTPFGQWVEIGGISDQQNEIIKEILSRGSSSGNTANSMSIMVQRQ
jgi:Bacterial type II/III secretion system short domain/Bacterial type II and III secretion system protein